MSITSSPQGSRSSAVRFPRFEVEKKTGIASSRNIEQIARLRPWVSPTIARLLISPLSATANQNANQSNRAGWSGRAPKSSVETMPSAVLPDPVTGRSKIFGAAIVRHWNVWDPRGGSDAKRDEIILSSRDTEDGPATEVAALLVDASDIDLQVPGKKGNFVTTVRTAMEQQLVITSGENTAWHEPTEPFEIDIAKGYLFYMSLLANTPSRK